MPLVKCSECGHNVATDAPSCPSCGHRMAPAAVPRKQGSGKKAALIVLGLILLLGFIGSLTKGGTGPSSSSSSSGTTTLVDTAATSAKPSAQATYANRQKFAEDYENNMLQKGVDMHASTLGSEARTLRLQYVLISRPLAYQLSNDQDIMRNLQSLGFRKVIMTDGYDETYNITIDPLPGDAEAPAARAAAPKKKYKWVADPKLEVFYYTTPLCQPARALLKRGGFQTFATSEDALSAGYRRSDSKGCDD
jgi:zinc ribbon protein